MVTLTAIFVLKIQQFCLYLPEALFDTTKTMFQMKGLVVRLGSYLNSIGDFIPSYDHFHYLQNSLKFTCLSAKINKRSLLR